MVVTSRQTVCKHALKHTKLHLYLLFYQNETLRDSFYKIYIPTTKYDNKTFLDQINLYYYYIH